MANSLTSIAFADLEREILVTRRVLERLPEQQFGWRVHEKSMPLGHLAQHVVNLLKWFLDTAEKDFFDMAEPHSMPVEAKSLAELLKNFDENAAAVRAAMTKIDDGALAQPWSLRKGSQALFTQPRAQILRTWCLSHLIHHRAQLCVYLRILNVPVPAVYFNSADEPEWTFA